MGDRKLPGNPRCVTCHTICDGYTSITGKDHPETGDPCVCVYCNSLNVFVLNPLTGHVSIRMPTPKERKSMLKDPRIRRVMQAIPHAGLIKDVTVN